MAAGEDDCVSLAALLDSFSAPVTEEHAWALIHQVLPTPPSLPWPQALSSLQGLMRGASVQSLSRLEGPHQLLLTPQGTVSPRSLAPGPGSHRPKVLTEGEAVADIGATGKVIFPSHVSANDAALFAAPLPLDMFQVKIQGCSFSCYWPHPQCTTPWTTAFQGTSSGSCVLGWRLPLTGWCPGTGRRRTRGWGRRRPAG